MGQADPLVDVVIPVYNGERTIRRAVESVLSQTYQRTHLIVVDDGSTDSTSTILREFHDPRLSVVSRPHDGVSAARNAGIAAGTGDYVTFLDADDECDPRWLRVLVRLADGAALVGCAGRIEQEGRPARVGAPVRRCTTDACGPSFLAGLFMVKRDVLEQAGGYDPRIGPIREHRPGLSAGRRRLRAGRDGAGHRLRPWSRFDAPWSSRRSTRPRVQKVRGRSDAREEPAVAR